MEKGKLLYEGKAKQVYATGNPDEVIVFYKDDATAFNGGKKGTITGKGVINNQMSAILFEMLEAKGIPTHMLSVLSEREQLVRSVEIVPLEVIIRNTAAGSMCKRLGIEEGMELLEPIFEICYKNDEFGDPLINDDHAVALGLATRQEIKTIKDYTMKINEMLLAFFAERGIRLIDFKLEFGRYKGEILLADEISPDTCRFWDAETGKKLDKDRFRRDLGDVESVYAEMLSRVKGE
ncbi:phosphoribosylaminoimidazolesuccinocarboxamide synthase [Gottschalkiaceae bacterium SANA]|nr:phosphoribosylaminoimidazolesuccinocarboxamide synthase [Gottschalkiaceae bacterium SANA]